MRTLTPDKAGPREWIGLAVLTLPTILIALDMNVLHLAVPSLTEDLNPSSSQLLWIIDIYGFLIAGFLITMGNLGDRVGRRRVLLYGAAAFGLASVLAAFAPNANLLIVARALLGIAGATLMPSTMSLIRNMFAHAGQRRTAITVWMTSFMGGSAVAPLVGGIMLERLWWGSVFLLGVPVMLLLLAVGPWLLPEYRDPKPGRLDPLSVVLSVLAVLAVIYGLKAVAEDGVGVVPVAVVLAGVALAVGFVRRQRVLDDPLLDLKLLRIPEFSVSLSTQTIAVFSMGGVMLFMAQYLQLVAGLSPLESGLVMVPGTVFGIVGTLLLPRLVRWVRPAYLIGFGALLAAGGMLFFTQVDASGQLWLIVAGHIVVSLGFGPPMSLTADLIIGSAPPNKAGAAGAASETSGELGLALGVAIFGSIGTAIYRSNVAVPDAATAVQAETVEDTLGGAVSVARDLPGEAAAGLLESARSAFSTGMALGAGIGAVLVALISVLVVTKLRHLEAGTGDGEAEPEAAEPERVPESAEACRTA
ncbi:MFS transporter [Stackebrandtia nassauensis]|uniref:Major facilitator superfamily MFS_1 n=1 Tax=Stackebrandtia nassauensis (strain DSM 44728 / CIP 108903 / NRRL B-16338 / NBRC 102104 / LLR-40K-21) TaxID=446470 RepID=D3Q745_STANL|nr:MFS transporter [Stackebrandtia nassauensis]ADD42316.1 major facilitator superfamily MFS_1 [Stackebrandtia nassauensis DSM 44728]